MSWLLVQALWFGLAASIILVDRQLVNSRVDPEVPDLKDRSVGPYLLLMLLFGGLIIPFYLWQSRRSGAAILAGIGLMIACGVVVSMVAGALR